MLPVDFSRRQSVVPPSPGSDLRTRRNPWLPTPRIGFSLIELVAVLILMGMLATIASVSIRGVIVRQRLARAAEIVEQFDTSLRRAARAQRRAFVGVIDRRRRTLTIKQAGDVGRKFQLPRQVSIDAIKFSVSRPSGPLTEILASPNGASPTYALQLSIGDSRQWILIAGGSGQVVHGLSNPSVNSILELR